MCIYIYLAVYLCVFLYLGRCRNYPPSRPPLLLSSYMCICIYRTYKGNTNMDIPGGGPNGI